MSAPENSTSAANVQQYSLKWTNHTNNILQMFSEQLTDENLVDVTLSCEGKFIKAHKLVLSACSPYFQELFKVHRVDHPLIILTGVPFLTLKQMIDFMYQGEIKVGSADLDQLLKTAKNLQLKGLSKIRRESIGDTPFSSNLMQTSDAPVVPESPSKGRKRRKLSHPPSNADTHGSDTECQVNGDDNTSEQTSVPELKQEDEEDRSTQKEDPSTSKANTSSPKSSQSLGNSSEERLDYKLVAKIPRPPNAFMIFANEWRKKLAGEHLGESNKEISVRLGNMWKALPTGTKEFYYQASRKADQAHKVKYPGYYYSPKEARIRKEMRGSSPRATSSSSTSTTTFSFVRSVMPESKDNEIIIADDIKDEPEDGGLFDDDNNDSNSDSSAENRAAATTVIG